MAKMNAGAWKIGAAAVLLTAATATAHQGVQNPAVLDRMNGMTAMADAMEVLVTMMRGSAEFDADRANAAIAAVGEEAGRVIPLFATEETDPASEALPAIWEEFADFEAKARDLELVAARFAGSVVAPEDLRGAVRALGQSCGACHDAYREEG